MSFKQHYELVMILWEKLIEREEYFRSDIINIIELSENLCTLEKVSFNSINLIYIDPPFNSGNDYITFKDKWDSELAYLSFMIPRLRHIHRVLRNNGSFYIHLDINAIFLLKPILDKIFGIKNFRGQIIWNVGSTSGFKSQRKGWIRQHDVILYYTKSHRFTFNKQYLPYNENYIKKMFRYEDDNGRIYRKRRNGRQYLDESPGVPLGNVWNDIISFQTKTNSKEYTRYPTQKPVDLIERIILASSNKGDLVADFFCGSGTSLVAAKKLGRKYFGVDNNKEAIEITQKRLESID